MKQSFFSSKMKQVGFVPTIILIGILILGVVSGGIYFVVKRNPFVTSSQNLNYYDNLIQQCNRFGSGAGGCCRSSVERMKTGNFLLEPKEGCPQGFKRNMLKCIETYKWCESTNQTTNSQGVPLGSESEAFFDKVEGRMQKQGIDSAPMIGSNQKPCDIDNNGKCDKTDFDLFQKMLGSCRGQSNYNPIADADISGCITKTDQGSLFGDQFK